jgi:hypothetical protein
LQWCRPSCCAGTLSLPVQVRGQMPCAASATASCLAAAGGWPRRSYT